MATNYTYDNLSRLLSVLHQVGGATIDGASYTLDNAGNRTSKTDQLANVTTNYGYDQIYQLLSATQGNSTTESYSYDAVGNRLSALNSSGWTYNASNELTAIPGVPPLGGSYTYDANGNTLTDAQGRAYTWDYENRLTQVVVPATGVVNFKYDPMGKRVYKSSSSGTFVYAYDGDNQIEETDSTGAEIARYSQALGIDGPLATLGGGTFAYYEADALGSITSLSFANGTLEQAYSYDPFGNTTVTGSLFNPFQYTGRESDPETDLYYYRARYYDPSTGRFVSEDPLRFSAGPSFFRYANNSPATFTDPLGLDPKDPCCGRRKVAVVARPYRRRNVAAMAAEAIAIPRTSDYNDGKTDYEFGGWILKKGDQYFYTDPMRGCVRGKTDYGNMIVPAGYEKVAMYHTHPDAGGEGFSVVDVNRSNAENIVEYVGMVYSGNVRVYIPGVTVIPEDYMSGAVIGTLIGNVKK